MNIKKITAFAAAMAMAAGICTGVPASTETGSLLAVTAEAASSDFVIKTIDGVKVLTEYKGKGGDIVIPNGVEWIDNGVFTENTSITGVTVPESCYSVGAEAFSFCINLKKAVFNGNALIGDNAFDNCFRLESVTVKGSIYAYIGVYAFRDCHSLKTVSINENEEEFEIGGAAFQNCYSLKSINIPSKCTMIWNYAFLNCLSLEKLTIPENTDIYDEDAEKCTFGYANMFSSAEAAHDWLYGTGSGPTRFVADGKKSGYVLVGGDSGVMFGDDNITYGMLGTKFTPKQLTVTVTKGSPAEKYCKATKVKYVYAKSTETVEKAAAPANIKASKTKNSVTLTWDKADGAAMYRVYKYNDKTGKYEKYKDVTSAKCTVSGLKAGTKYKFKVVSYSKNNGKSVMGGSSKVVSVTTKK